MRINELKTLLFSDTTDVINLIALFDKKPEDIIYYFKSKNIVITKNWKEYYDYLLSRNIFSIAGITKTEILNIVYHLILSSQESDLSYDKFKNSIQELITSTGFIPNQDKKILESPARLKLIFRQNNQTSFMAGRYKQMIENANIRPYWRYVGVEDNNSRLNHLEVQNFFKNKVVKYNNPFWLSWYPPNGFNCRCGVESYTLDEVNKRNLIITSAVPYFRQDEGFNTTPDKLITLVDPVPLFNK